MVDLACPDAFVDGPPHEALAVLRRTDWAIMAEAKERRDVEFVHQVASPLPTRVIGELFGLPQQDWDHIHELAERNTSSQDPDISDAGVEDATMEMAMYAIELAANRRKSVRTFDLTSAILDADFGGRPMSDIEFGSFFVQLVTAGNDTTKGMLGSGLLTLLQHPDQLAELRADASLIPGAVEEIIRYANPLHYFRRTALADVELSGTHIAEGDKVAMYYTSANRDDEVFSEPQTFDIHRHPNPHLSFGIGSHSASASTWPGSRAGCSSRNSSIRSERSSRPAIRCGSARI